MEAGSVWEGLCSSESLVTEESNPGSVYYSFIHSKFVIGNEGRGPNTLISLMKINSTWFES